MTKTCANCGTDNRDDAKFCKGCGQSLANAETGSAGLEMAGFSCPVCGHVNRAEAQFCAKCGAQPALAAPPPPLPPAQAATVKLPERPPVGVGVVVRPADDAAGPPPSHKRAVAWLALSLVVVAVAGTTAWWTLGRSGLKPIPAAATDATAVVNTAPKVAAPVSVPTAAIAKPAPTSGPHPKWHGTWQGTKPDSKMVISATGVEIFDGWKSDGKAHELHQMCMCTWVKASEASGNGEEW